MSTNYDVILSPVITEKATRMTEANQVVFRVTLDATKPAIAKAVSDLFKVKVKAVNTVIVKGYHAGHEARPTGILVAWLQRSVGRSLTK